MPVKNNVAAWLGALDAACEGGIRVEDVLLSLLGFSMQRSTSAPWRKDCCSVALFLEQSSN